MENQVHCQTISQVIREAASSTLRLLSWKHEKEGLKMNHLASHSFNKCLVVICGAIREPVTNKPSAALGTSQHRLIQILCKCFNNLVACHTCLVPGLPWTQASISLV